MTKHDDNGIPQEAGGTVSCEALEQRIHDLENEVRQLRVELEKARQEAEIERQELESYHALGLPLSEAEMLEQARTGPSISDVIAECDREFGK